MHVSEQTRVRRWASRAALLCGGALALATVVTTQASAQVSNDSRTSAAIARITGLTQPADRPGAVTPALAPAVRSATPATAWAAIPNLPIPVEDNTVGFDNGTVYSALGVTGDIDTVGLTNLTSLYSFTPGHRGWTKLASAPIARAQASSAFLGGKFYVTDGWDTNDVPTGRTDVYDPATNTWTSAAPSPVPVAEAATTVLNGRMYVIGGCGPTSDCTSVEVYDPVTNTWSSAASYPEVFSLGACGTIAGKIYCAGGVGHTASITHAYVYDPATNAWSAIADMPIDLFGSAYTAANGELLVQNGVTDDGLVETNQGVAYHPATNTWSALPDALVPHFRGGSALGFYQIGGAPHFTGTEANSEVLAGFDTP